MSPVRFASLLAVVAAVGCSNSSGSSASASGDGAPSKPSGPPSNIRAAMVKSPSPVAAAYTTGKAASGMWKAKFDLTNNGAKDTKKVSFFECTYDTNGKISGPAAQMLQSEAMIDIKPKAKGSTEIAFMSDGLGPNYQVALMIHTVTWSDDSKWHDPANGMCPASLK